MSKVAAHVCECGGVWGKGADKGKSHSVCMGVVHTGKRIVRVATCGKGGANLRHTDGERNPKHLQRCIHPTPQSGSGLAGLLGCGCSSSCRRGFPFASAARAWVQVLPVGTRTPRADGTTLASGSKLTLIGDERARKQRP